MSAPTPMHGDMEACVIMYGTVCVVVIPLLVPPLVQNVYMHQYMYLCPHDSPCLLHSLCIVTWKCGCSCMALHVHPSHLITVLTPWLECIHVSVHVFMSTQLPLLGKSPMDSYTETWVLTYVTVCVFQSTCL